MRFLLSVIDASSGTATGDEIAAIDDFNDSLQSNGHWIMAAGIGGPETAITIDNRGGAGLSAPGPFVKTNEYLSGFWIIEAASTEVAVQLAEAGSRACNRKVEVRPFLG